MLEKEPGGTIIYDVRASWAVRDTVERLGRHGGREPRRPRLHQAAGCARWTPSSPARSPATTTSATSTRPTRGRSRRSSCSSSISKAGTKLSELLRPFRERYFLTGEINTPVADVALKLQELKEHFADQGEVSHLDGISITADDWHMNVGPSNTEPLLRLNLEALDPQLMERKRDEVLAVISGSRRSGDGEGGAEAPPSRNSLERARAYGRRR